VISDNVGIPEVWATLTYAIKASIAAFLASRSAKRDILLNAKGALGADFPAPSPLLGESVITLALLEPDWELDSVGPKPKPNPAPASSLHWN
jgi:hypothetical protein